MERFEYKILMLRLHGLKAEWYDEDVLIGPTMSASLLNEYGEQGWEVVTVRLGESVVLKRKK